MFILMKVILVKSLYKDWQLLFMAFFKLNFFDAEILF